MTHIVKNKPRRGGQVGAASIMREALASVADDQDGAPPRRTRGARGGRMGWAGGARGRGAAPRYKCVTIFKKILLLIRSSGCVSSVARA